MGKIIYPIESERLLIQPYTMEYCENLFELNQLKETHRYNYTKPKNKNEIKKYVEELCSCDYQNPVCRFELSIISKKTKTYLGYIGCKAGELQPGKSTEIYYTIHPLYFNQDYAILEDEFTQPG